MRIQNTLTPYKELEHLGIQYSTCRDYGLISRYSGLRQLVHAPYSGERFISLETSNPFSSTTEVVYHDVKSHEENRLDLISNMYLGSPTYAWVIAYFNNIEDGFTVREGQRLAIPKSISSLFNKGEMLAPVSALQLNLGEE